MFTHRKQAGRIFKQKIKLGKLNDRKYDPGEQVLMTANGVVSRGIRRGEEEAVPQSLLPQ